MMTTLDYCIIAPEQLCHANETIKKRVQRDIKRPDS